jgi:hypothetical protein
MAESQTVVILRSKRKDIEREIANYTKQIERLKVDLIHVNSTLSLFETDAVKADIRLPMSTARLYRRGEMFAACTAILAGHPDGLDTRELAEILMDSKGMDKSDRILRKSFTMSLVHVLSARARRRQILTPGKRNFLRIWKNLPPTPVIGRPVPEKNVNVDHH